MSETWPEAEYIVHGIGAFARSNLAPCRDCGATAFEIVERANGSTWAECGRCCQKRGRNGRLLGTIDVRTGEIRDE